MRLSDLANRIGDRLLTTIVAGLFAACGYIAWKGYETSQNYRIALVPRATATNHIIVETTTLPFFKRARCLEYVTEWAKEKGHTIFDAKNDLLKIEVGRHQYSVFCQTSTVNQWATVIMASFDPKPTMKDSFEEYNSNRVYRDVESRLMSAGTDWNKPETSIYGQIISYKVRAREWYASAELSRLPKSMLEYFAKFNGKFSECFTMFASYTCLVSFPGLRMVIVPQPTESEGEDQIVELQTFGMSDYNEFLRPWDRIRYRDMVEGIPGRFVPEEVAAEGERVQ